MDDPDKDSGGKIEVSLNISLPNLHCDCEYIHTTLHHFFALHFPFVCFLLTHCFMGSFLQFCFSPFIWQYHTYHALSFYTAYWQKINAALDNGVDWKWFVYRLCCGMLRDNTRFKASLRPVPPSVWSCVATQWSQFELPLLARLLYFNVREVARTESSHWLFAPHDSRQKLCPMTHTHTDWRCLGSRSTENTHLFDSSDIQKWQS